MRRGKGGLACSWSHGERESVGSEIKMTNFNLLPCPNVLQQLSTSEWIVSHPHMKKTFDKAKNGNAVTFPESDILADSLDEKVKD